MLKRIRLTNFFSFQDVTIDFEKDVNLLVGINGSGKSNLFKAIQLLKVGVTGNSENNALFRLIVEEWGGFDNIFFKGEKVENGQTKIGLEFVFYGEYFSKNSKYKFADEVNYSIEIIRKNNFDNYYLNEQIWEEANSDRIVYLDMNAGNGALLILLGQNNESPLLDSIQDNDSKELLLSRFYAVQGYQGLQIIQAALRNIETYPYFDTTQNSRIRRASSSSSTIKKLLPNGKNLPQLLHTLKLKNKPIYRQIIKSLQDINPNFNNFDFNVLGRGQMEMYLDENDLDSAIHLAHISDGTLRYLCLLSIFLNPNRGSLVCIDEPEIGLHPDMIFNIYKLMEKAGEETTFIIATHSSALLNTFKVNQIRVFEKEANNATVVKQFAEKDFEGWYDEFNPGSMWTAGDLGGNRW